MSEDRLRIAVVTPVFPTSAEPYRGNYNYNIVKSMQRHAEIKVFVPLAVVPRWKFLEPRSTRYNAVDPKYSPGGIPVEYLPYSSLPIVTRPLNGFHAAVKITPGLKRFKPDVVLAYWIYPEGFGAMRVAQSMKVPIVLGALGSDLRRLSDPVSNLLMIHTLNQASMVVTVSEEMRQQAISFGVQAHQVRTILNGCDLSVFRPGDRLEARRKLGIPPETELILFVGWLSPTKGLGELVAAVKTLGLSRPNLCLACIGEGAMAKELWQVEKEFGGSHRFRILGARTSREISTWLAASNLLALPSYSEGCPNVVIEALACGRPVVASYVGGIPEILPPEAGILVPSRNAKALTEALATALDRKWDNNRIAAEQSRSWDQVADETFETCREVYRQANRRATVATSRYRPAEPTAAPFVNTKRDDRLRIAVVTPMFPTSAEPYRGWPIYKTATELQQFADVKVICPIYVLPRWQVIRPRSTRYHKIDPDYNPPDIDVTYTMYRSMSFVGRPLNGQRSAAKIESPIRAFAPDIILAYWIYPDGYAALQVGRKLGLPVIIGSRGSDMALKDPLSRFMALDALRKADCVLTVSEDLRRTAIGYGVSPGRVLTIHNGIDASIFHVNDQRQARSDLGMSPDDKLIVFIGWLNETKGVNELLAAVEQLVRETPSVKVVFIGEGPLRRKLLDASTTGPLVGHVQVLGPFDRQEIVRWISAGDLLCLPSWAEGCPNVILEALACGRPVVASRVGGIPELVTEETGILVEPRRVDPLTEALRTALFHRRWDEAEIAQHWTRSWQTVAQDTYDVCVKVVAARKSRSHAGGILVQ